MLNYGRENWCSNKYLKHSTIISQNLSLCDSNQLIHTRKLVFPCCVRFELLHCLNSRDLLVFKWHKLKSRILYLLIMWFNRRSLPTPPSQEVSFQKIKARFDVALRKVRTMETLQIFSVSCNFNPSAFISKLYRQSVNKKICKSSLEFITSSLISSVCHPDGTIMISAQMKTVPAIDMSKTKLRDSSCKPKEYNKGHAFFMFHVTTCGTSVRVSPWPEQIHLLEVSVSPAFSHLLPCPSSWEDSVFNELPICTVWRWSHCLWKWNLLRERDSSRPEPAENHKRSRLQVGAASAHWRHSLWCWKVNKKIALFPIID